MSNSIPSDRTYDVLSVGELLADFISTNLAEDIANADEFRRFPGGSPANLARNLAVLGKQAALVATVGDDGLGRYLVRELTDSGVNTEHVAIHPTRPTSAVLIARSTETPDFIHYRQADTDIGHGRMPESLVRDCRIFHTTCVALSSDEARPSILEAARRAAESGGHLSIDANYARPHWKTPESARLAIKSYCRGTTLLKLSMDDAERIFEDRDIDPGFVIESLHRWGAWLVCLTLGANGSRVSWKGGEEHAFVEAEAVDEVHGATGAGDAFWSGFLTGWLDGQTPAQCADIGSRVAARKVRVPGPLTSAPAMK